MKTKFVPACALVFAIGAGLTQPGAAAPAGPASIPPGSGIDGPTLLRHIAVLASDEFEGRAPASKGEQLTLAYLTAQFKQLGLTPGAADGGWLQKVPMRGIRSQPSFSYGTKGKRTSLAFPGDYVARSWLAQPKVDLAASELVFVGYGVVAPEYNWDDYKGMDLRGKTLLMLINDPPIVDGADPSRLDRAVFGGPAMTYYGRWTYKYEIAARLGAAGAIIIHETKPAAYGYDVLRAGAVGEGFMIAADGPNPDFPTVPGWIQLDKARAMLASAGQDFDALKAAAARRDFKPVALGIDAAISVSNQWRDVTSYNVLARIDGSDPRLKDEVVVYSAHWDHMGIDTTLPGPRTKQIYHGAQDNASGVAGLLELARAYKALPVAPLRSIVFLVTTGEEQGLLGSEYYVRAPVYPLAKTRININMDGLNMLGPMHDISIVGLGRSNIDDMIAQIARGQGRTVREDDPELGRFFRSDQFPFAKRGVPAVFTRSGVDMVGKPAGTGARLMGRFRLEDYHHVSDVVNPAWDMGGAVQDLRLLFQLGYDVAQGRARPEWKAGAEFKAAHEALMKAK